MSNLSKIGLGTVQFGIDYGITNQAGMTPLTEVADILDLAAANSIATLDTAHLYGQSESVLGQALKPEHKFEIITKTPDFGRVEITQAGDTAKLLKDTFQSSLEKLKVSSVYGLMVHNAGGLAGPWAKEIYDALLGLKQAGKVKKIGASVYSARDIDQILEHCGPIDIVQVPVNLFDQRLIATGYLKELKAKNVEIHARSLFLQGSLLATQVPERLKGFASFFAAYQDFLKHHTLTPLQACLEFGFSVPEIDRLIIGVNNKVHLQEIIAAAAQTGQRSFNFSGLASSDEDFINPAKWPKV
jgi:aryl-alcohol dehydrogenase-like predicted oxidoreductase